MTDGLAAGVVTHGLAAGVVFDPRTVELTHEPVPDEQLLDGEPTTGIWAISESSGVWEMTPGSAHDIEEDEIFVVLSGRAEIVFISPKQAPLSVGPGSVVRLTAGMHTEWTVTETLRKLYWTP